MLFINLHFIIFFILSFISWFRFFQRNCIFSIYVTNTYFFLTSAIFHCFIIRRYKCKNIYRLFNIYLGTFIFFSLPLFLKSIIIMICSWMCRIQTFEDSCYNNKQYFSRKSDGFMSDSRGGGGGRMILLYNSHHMAIIFKAILT